MSTELHKEVVKKKLEDLKNSQKREVTYLKEVENDKGALAYVKKMIEDKTPFPSGEDVGYTSYEEWKTSLEKELKSDESSLERIKEEKSLIVALEYYITNAV